MKSLINIISVLIVALVVFACHEDEGNYDYNYLAEIEVDNVSGEFYYKYGAEINIEPSIITTIPEDELSYMWLRIVTGQGYDTLSLEKNLNTYAHFPDCNIQLRVIHNPSGIHHTFSSDVFVSLPFSSGWAVLSDKGTHSEFNFLSGVERDQQNNILWEYFPNTYYNTNGTHLPANPKSLNYSVEEKLWVVSLEKDGQCFNMENMVKAKAVSEYIGSNEYIQPPYNIDYINLGNDRNKDGTRMITSGGDLFAAIGVLSGSEFKFYAPILGEHYIKDKIIAVGDMHQLFFDEQARRFMFVNLRNSKSESKAATLAEGTDDKGIDVTNLSMDCVFLEYAGISWDNPIFYSILKNSQGEYFLVNMDDNFDTGNIDPNPYDLRIKNTQKIDPSVINENTKIFIPKGSKNIFFITGNKIHIYVGANNVFYNNWFEATGDIKAFYLNMGSNSEFAIALPNGQNSKVEIRSFPKAELIKTLSVEGEVKDLSRI